MTKFSIDQLKAAFDKAIQQYRDLGFETIEIEEDYYWSIPYEYKYDVGENFGEWEPQEFITCGQITDDIAHLQRIAMDLDDPNPTSLAWIAEVLLVIAERSGRRRD